MPAKNAASDRTRWGLVLLIVASGMAGACHIGKTPPSVPLLRAELDLTLLAVGWVISLFSLIGALGGIFAGVAADWLGQRFTLILGVVITGLASLAGSLSQGAPLLLLTRFLEGLGYLVVIVSAPALIVKAAKPRDLRLAFGVWSCFMPAGASTMMVISPFILGLIGWRGLWIVNGLLGLAFALVLARATRDLSHPQGQATGSRFRSVLADLWLIASSPGPILLALCFGLYAFMFMAVIGFLPTLLIEDLGFGQAAASALSAAVVFMNVPGNLLAGLLLQKGARRVVLLLGAGLAMALTGIGIYAGALPAFFRFALALLFSGFGGIIPASLFAATPAHAPRPTLVSTTNGLMIQGANCGSTLGPPALALVVADFGGWSAAPWLLTAAALASLALALALGRLEK